MITRSVGMNAETTNDRPGGSEGPGFWRSLDEQADSGICACTRPDRGCLPPAMDEQPAATFCGYWEVRWLASVEGCRQQPSEEMSHSPTTYRDRAGAATLLCHRRESGRSGDRLARRKPHGSSDEDRGEPPASGRAERVLDRRSTSAPTSDISRRRPFSHSTIPTGHKPSPPG